ncbi:MAG: hypothetical protein V3U80_01490 [Flavobacteriaceae bacterium]
MISLVAITGVFLLMSFTSSVEKKKPSEELQDECYQAALEFVNALEGLTSDQEYGYHGSYYDWCIGGYQ